jgi:transcriptional regulator
MYIPRLFEGSPEVTRELLLAHPFATVIGAQPDGELEVTHVPLIVEGDGASLRLSGHVARGNPFARLIAAGAKVTAVFHGPDGYVSASVYESPTEEVPTWNYAVVHVRGTLRPLDDAALTEQLETMAKRFERGATPWHPNTLAPDFFADLRRGIVGFAIEATQVRTKLKLSQNRSSEDRRRAEAAFAASDAPRDHEVAALMQRVSST